MEANRIVCSAVLFIWSLKLIVLFYVVYGLQCNLAVISDMVVSVSVFISLQIKCILDCFEFFLD